MKLMIKGIQKHKVPKGSKRSDKWPTVRAKHLKKFPACTVCGGIKNLEVHHIKPFHLHPKLELLESNLITLCENWRDGANCHLLFGHLGNFKSFNVHVETDSKIWNGKLITRPKPKSK